jgi:hypothetical protein
MKWRIAACVLPVALGIAGCSDDPVSPEPDSGAALADAAMEHVRAAMAQVQAGQVVDAQREGTGLVLESLTGLTLPLLGVELGDVVIDQAVLTDFFLVEDVVGSIVGLEVEGVLKLTGGVLGSEVVSEDFRTVVSVASQHNRCRFIGIDLGRIAVDVLGRTAFVDVPEATVTTRSAGVVGILLCFLGQLLETTITDPIANVIRAIVNVVNLLLI